MAKGPPNPVPYFWGYGFPYKISWPKKGLALVVIWFLLGYQVSEHSSDPAQRQETLQFRKGVGFGMLRFREVEGLGVLGFRV